MEWLHVESIMCGIACVYCVCVHLYTPLLQYVIQLLWLTVYASLCFSCKTVFFCRFFIILLYESLGCVYVIHSHVERKNEDSTFELVLVHFIKWCTYNYFVWYFWYFNLRDFILRVREGWKNLISSRSITYRFNFSLFS